MHILSTSRPLRSNAMVLPVSYIPNWPPKSIPYSLRDTTDASESRETYRLERSWNIPHAVRSIPHKPKLGGQSDRTRQLVAAKTQCGSSLAMYCAVVIRALYCDPRRTAELSRLLKLRYCTAFLLSLTATLIDSTKWSKTTLICLRCIVSLSR